MRDRDHREDVISHVRVTCEGIPHLRRAIEIAMSWDRKVTHYRVIDTSSGGQGLELYASENKDKGTSPLPFPLDAKSAPDFVFGWLKHATYQPGPDTDGHANRGWTVENHQSWNEPEVTIWTGWVVYGK